MPLPVTSAIVEGQPAWLIAERIRVEQVAADLARRLVRGRDLPARQVREAPRHQGTLDAPADRELVVEAAPAEELPLERGPLEGDRGLAGDRREEPPVGVVERPGLRAPAQDDGALRGRGSSGRRRRGSSRTRRSGPGSPRSAHAPWSGSADRRRSTIGSAFGDEAVDGLPVSDRCHRPAHRRRPAPRRPRPGAAGRSRPGRSRRSDPGRPPTLIVSARRERSDSSRRSTRAAVETARRPAASVAARVSAAATVAAAASRAARSATGAGDHDRPDRLAGGCDPATHLGRTSAGVSSGSPPVAAMTAPSVSSTLIEPARDEPSRRRRGAAGPRPHRAGGRASPVGHGPELRARQAVAAAIAASRSAWTGNRLAIPLRSRTRPTDGPGAARNSAGGPVVGRPRCRCRGSPASRRRASGSPPAGDQGDRMDCDQPGAAHVGQPAEVEDDPGGRRPRPRSARRRSPARNSSHPVGRSRAMTARSAPRSLGRDVHRRPPGPLLAASSAAGRSRLVTVTSSPPPGRIRWSMASVRAGARWISHPAERPMARAAGSSRGSGTEPGIERWGGIAKGARRSPRALTEPSSSISPGARRNPRSITLQASSSTAWTRSDVVSSSATMGCPSRPRMRRRWR